MSWDESAASVVGLLAVSHPRATDARVNAKLNECHDRALEAPTRDAGAAARVDRMRFARCTRPRLTACGCRGPGYKCEGAVFSDDRSRSQLGLSTADAPGAVATAQHEDGRAGKPGSPCARQSIQAQHQRQRPAGPGGFPEDQPDLCRMASQKQRSRYGVRGAPSQRGQRAAAIA